MISVRLELGKTEKELSSSRLEQESTEKIYLEAKLCIQVTHFGIVVNNNNLCIICNNFQ